MKNFLLLITLSFFSFASCNGGGASLPQDDSLLWKVTGNGLEYPSYILGTHHCAPISVLDGYPAYVEALESASTVVGELDMSRMADAQSMMMAQMAMPEGATYHDLLTDDEYTRLDEKLKENFGMGLDYLGAQKPSMLFNMYTAISYFKANPSFDPMTHIAIDTYVQNLGLESGKEIIGLETFEEQIELLINFEPLEVQAALLLCSLEHDEDTIETLIEGDRLYREGRVAEMYEISFGSDKKEEPCQFSEEFETAMLKIRNDNWMRQIPSIMSEGPSFIAVGALHLGGEVGILHQLRELGYTVEPIR